MKRNARSAFSLLEIIAVLAIISILSATLVPDLVRSIDGASVAEEENILNAYGETLKLYLREEGSTPDPADWHTDLAFYTDQNSDQVIRNERRILRTYIEDPADTPTQRLILLSSMRQGLDVAAASDIDTDEKFQTLWDTAADAIPATSTWSGWSDWSAIDGAERYLLIQRINLRPIYANELETFSASINNTRLVTSSYEVYDPDGNLVTSGNLSTLQTVTLDNLGNGSRIDIFENADGADLAHTHFVVDTSETFNLLALIGP